MAYDPADFGISTPEYVRSDGSVQMAANLDFGTFKGINAADPDNPQDVATKQYVDDNAGGVTDVQAAGYWSPLTNGNPASPELIFDDEGDAIAVWTGA